MAYSVLQAASANQGSGASQALAYSTANVSTGNKMVVLVAVGGGAFSTSTVKDNNNNSFTLLKRLSYAGGNFDLTLWALTVPAGDNGTKPTITATFNATAVGASMTILEVSGLTTDDTTAQNDGAIGTATGSFTAASTLTVTGTTTTASAEYLACFYGDDGNQSALSAGTGFTKDSGDDPTNVVTTAAEHKDSTNGAETGTWAAGLPAGNTNYGLIMAAWKLATAVTAGVPIRKYPLPWELLPI